MRILLDECVTKRLKPYLQEIEVVTVSEMKCNGIKNGKLMSLCIENDFDLILTIDKN
jgi:predicted nuclease of predicted toxin-antitoxin system